MTNKQDDLCFAAFSRHVSSSAHHGHVDVVVVRQRVQHLHHGRLHQPQREPADAAAPAGKRHQEDQLAVSSSLTSASSHTNRWH